MIYNDCGELGACSSNRRAVCDVLAGSDVYHSPFPPVSDQEQEVVLPPSDTAGRFLAGLMDHSLSLVMGKDIIYGARYCLVETNNALS